MTWNEWYDLMCDETGMPSNTSESVEERLDKIENQVKEIITILKQLGDDYR